MENNKKDFFKKNSLDNFDKLLDQILVLFSEEKELVETIKNWDDETKLIHISNFHKSLKNEGLFTMFMTKKIKLFSSKKEETKAISKSLFGNNLSLKNVFNNQSDEIKKVLWNYLHFIYLTYESIEKENEERITRIENLYKINPDIDKKNALNLDVNKDTNNMINDILSSFEAGMDKGKQNPFDNILQISEMISDKYSNKINNGEIEIEKLLENVTSNLPGMDKIMTGMTGGMPKKKEKIIIDENFSTDKVELGDKDAKSGPNIGQMFGMINKLSSLGESGDLSQLLGGNKDLSPENQKELDELNKMMMKLDTTSDPKELDEIKNSVDGFFKNNIGLDVSKIDEMLQGNSELNKGPTIDIEDKSQ